MLSLLKWFFERVDFIGLADAQRNRKNRKIAASLLTALLLAYEIIEIFEKLLGQLSEALESHRANRDKHEFTINDHWITSLLEQQADNLDKLDHIFRSLYDEVRLIDPKFEKTYSRLFPWKYGVLMDAQALLRQARLPTDEDHPLPAVDQYDQYYCTPYTPGLTYRTLWFSPATPSDDRENERRLLYDDDDADMTVVDIHVSDGEPFFAELERYFREANPRQLLDELKATANSYREALERNLTLSDVLAEIGEVRRRW